MVTGSAGHSFIAKAVFMCKHLYKCLLGGVVQCKDFHERFGAGTSKAPKLMLDIVVFRVNKNG